MKCIVIACREIKMKEGDIIYDLTVECDDEKDPIAKIYSSKLYYKGDMIEVDVKPKFDFKTKNTYFKPYVKHDNKNK